MIHPDDIKYAKAIIVQHTRDTGYGLMLPVHISLLREAIKTIEEMQAMKCGACGHKCPTLQRGRKNESTQTNEEDEKAGG